MPLINTHRFSDLVGKIYDCAIIPAKWHDVLEQLCRETGLVNSTFSLHVPLRGQLLLKVSTGMSEADSFEQFPYELDIVELWGGEAEAMRRPIDTPWVASRLQSQQQIAQNRFVREWAAPRGIVDCIAVVVGRDPGLIGSIAMGRHRDSGLIDDETVAKVQLFLPHLQRAARISGLLEANADAISNFEAMIHAIVSPVIMVRKDLSVVFSNGAAEAFLATGELFALSDGRLSSTVPGVERAIHKLVARIGADEIAIPGSGTGFPIQNQYDQLHTLHVLPLGKGSDRPQLASEAVAAIFISSTAIPHNLARDVLIPLFELTPAEVRVFESIVSGATTSETAEALGCAQSTVRTHLLRLFEKTGVNRQADLIRMAYSLASPTAANPGFVF